MSDEPFTLDTNILIYSIDLKAGDRHELAKQIIRRSAPRPCLLALQAISEFYAAVTRKRLIPPSRDCQVANDLMDLFPTVPATATAVRAALATAAAGQASYWDALLVATAAEAGCTTILTEDLADGSRLFGVRILNPFAGGTLAPDAAALLATD
jgi:predicted nucleic acid-binding protein